MRNSEKHGTVARKRVEVWEGSNSIEIEWEMRNNEEI